LFSTLDFGDWTLSTRVSEIPLRSGGGKLMLERVLMARRCRRRAAECMSLAETATPEERNGHLIVAEHYRALADAEERSVKTTLEERFPRMRTACQLLSHATTPCDVRCRLLSAEFSQPERLSARKSAWRLMPEKCRAASHRADRRQRMRIPLVRIPVFLYFALSLSLKIVWAARSDQVQLPSVADSPQAQHRLRRELAVGVL
jgi:hypothetical protein